MLKVFSLSLQKVISKMIKNDFQKLGEAVALLESKRMIDVKKLIQKHNPQNTLEGFLYHAEKAIEMSNEVSELLVNANETSLLPILTAKSVERYNFEKTQNVFSFWVGYNSKSLELINKVTASEMGKRGDKANAGAKIQFDTPEAKANRERVRKSRAKKAGKLAETGKD